MKTFERLLKEEIVKTFPDATQPWVDQRGWAIYNDTHYSLQIWIYEDFATVSPRGYGANQALIATSTEQVKECADMWMRNRKLVTQ